MINVDVEALSLDPVWLEIGMESTRSRSTS
jgi:hypothetical protein